MSRFVLGDDDLIDPRSETVLIDNIPSPSGNHNAGDLQFGKDGYLYVSVGDGGCDYAGDSGCAGAQQRLPRPHVLLGKILRITPTAASRRTIRSPGAGHARCNVDRPHDRRASSARRSSPSGLRNPFRFAFDPNAAGTRFFINDVGQNTWEEIDEGAAGADYGWNVREGHCASGSTRTAARRPPGIDQPGLRLRPHRAAAPRSPAGAFVPDGVWPAQYDGAYLFGDYVCGKIFRLVPNGGGGYTAAEFATGVGGAVAMAFGPPGIGSRRSTT